MPETTADHLWRGIWRGAARPAGAPTTTTRASAKAAEPRSPPSPSRPTPPVPAGAEAAPPGPPASPPPGQDPSAGGPPRRGKPAPRWLVTLIAVAAIALACVLVFVLFPRGGKDEGQGGPTPASGRRRRRLAVAASRPVPRRRRRPQGGPARGDQERRDGRAHHELQRRADLADRLLAGRQVAGLHRRHVQAQRAVALLRDQWRRPAGDGRDARHRRRRQRRLALGGPPPRRRLHGGAEGHRSERRPARLRRPRPELLAAGRRRRARATRRLRQRLPRRRQGRLRHLHGPQDRQVRHGLRQGAARAARARHRRGDPARRERSPVRRQRACVRRAPHLSQRRGRHLSPRRQRRGHQLHGRRRRRDNADAGPRDAVPGRLRVGPERGPRSSSRDTRSSLPTTRAASGRPSSGSSTRRPAPPTVLARYEDTMVQDLSWSPDGTSIAWAAYEQKKYRTGTVYLLPASGGDSTPLVEEALSPVWAPAATGSLQTSPSP